MAEDHYLKGRESPLKGTTNPGTFLSRKEFVALLEALNDEPEAQAIFVISCWAGLRVNKEVLNIRQGDIEWDDDGACVIHVRDGKGGKDRRVAMGAKPASYLKEWQKRIREDEEFVFQMNNQAYSRRLKKYAKIAGIRKNVKPHSGRHTYAFGLINDKFDLITIQKQLGHKDVGTTVKYADHFFPEERHEAMKRREW